MARPRLAAAVLFVVALWTSSAGADDPRQWVAQLSSPQAKERRFAAAQLHRDGRQPPPAAAAALLEAARVEPDQNTLREMLLALGETGVMEALGLLQTHALSPVTAVAETGRQALQRWLWRNRLLDEDEPIPEPPHPFYEPPPTAFPPDRTAGHALEVWLAPPGTFAVEPPPVYEAVDPDGVPPGYIVTERPRYPLVAVGLGVFGGLYLATTIGTAAAAASDNEEWDPKVLIPIVGPLFPAAELFDDRGLFSELSTVLGVIMVVDAFGQAACVGMAIAGAITTSNKLERPATLALSPTGARLQVAF